MNRGVSRLDAPLWRLFLETVPADLAREAMDNVIVIVIRRQVLELILDNGTRHIRAEDLISKKLCPLPANDCWIEYAAGDYAGHPVQPFALYVRERAWPADMGLDSKGHTHQVFFLKQAGDGPGAAVDIQLMFEWARGDRYAEGPIASARLALLHGQESRDGMDERFKAVPYHPGYDEAAAFAGGLLVQTNAVLAVRGLTTIAEATFKEKRIARVKGSVPPRMRYQVVDINVDAMPEGYEASGDGQGLGRALHHVRGHLRLTEKRGLVAVRPHWRGSIALGIIRKDMHICRDEEMPQ